MSTNRDLKPEQEPEAVNPTPESAPRLDKIGTAIEIGAKALVDIQEAPIDAEVIPDRGNLVHIEEFRAAKNAEESIDPNDEGRQIHRSVSFLDGSARDRRVAVFQSEEATPEDKQAAFNDIYKEFEHRIKIFAFKLVGSNEDAEEITQETFIKAWGGLNEFKEKDGGSLRPWLYMIARNTSFNHGRTTRKHPTNPSDRLDYITEDTPGLSGIVASGGPGKDPAKTVENREELAEKLEILDELPADYKAVLVMSSLDFSQVEMAQTLDKTVASIKSLLVRARASLSQRYELRQWTDIDFDEEPKDSVGEDKEATEDLSL